MPSEVNLWARNPADPDQDLVLLKNQAEFANSSAYATLLAGGWASAKTYAGIGFIARMLAKNPGCTGIVMQPTWRLLNDFIEQEFRPAFGHLILGENKTFGSFRLPLGSRVLMVSGSDPRKVEKYKAAWAYADEAGLYDKSILMRLSARLRDPNAKEKHIGLTGTPHFGWLKEEFGDSPDPKRRIIHARTADNIFLPPDYIENLKSVCPARMQACYMEGQFVAPGGGVYPEYDDKIHVTDWTYDPQFDTIAMIDWSPRTPHVLFAQLVPPGRYINAREMKRLDGGHQYGAMVVFDELVMDGQYIALTTEKLCQEILKRGYALKHFICDPAGGAVEAGSGLSQIVIATNALGIQPRYRTDPAGRSITAGVEHVKTLLEPMDGVPRLYLSSDLIRRAEKLPNNIRSRALPNAIREYSYETNRTGSRISEMPDKNGISDHACDCLRYGVVFHFPISRLAVRVHDAR